MALGVLAGAARATVLEGPITSPVNGHQYYIIAPETWSSAEAEAVSLGGFLATIRNQAENNWILNTFSNVGGENDNFWIGLYDPIANDGTGATHAADFIWASGAPVTYTNWSSGEPNDNPLWNGEQYTIMQRAPDGTLLPGDWNDANVNGDSVTTYGVVEVVPSAAPAPEPASLLLLLAAAPLLVGRSRNRR